MVFLIIFNKTIRDLKRDIASKLETLEKQTQKAIVELIRKKQLSDRERERERERGIEDRLKGTCTYAAVIFLVLSFFIQCTIIIIIYNFPIGERLKDDSEELAAVVAAQGQDPDDTNDTQDS